MATGIYLARGAVAIGAVLAGLAGTAAGGLDPESNTDGFDPAADAYRIGEARRLNAIARQLDLVYQMQWEYPYFPAGPPIRQPIGYESKQVGPDRWIYRPIYPQDVEGAADTLPAPDTPSQPASGKTPPELPAPADAKPEDLIPPKTGPGKPKRGGPREF